MQKLQANELRFFVIGDWGREGRYGQQETADCMAEWASGVDPHFIVSTGDNFYEYGVTDVHDPLWNKSYEQVYYHDSLQLPWYAVLGNHDYVLNAEAQIEYSAKSPRWNMPARYFERNILLQDATRIQVLYLDTSPFIKEYQTDATFYKASEQDSSAQLEWLTDRLESSMADWKVVVGHHPLYSAGSIHGDQEDMINAFEPIFERYQVHAYFCGHEHDVQHLKADGKFTHHFVSGAGSMVRETGSTNESKYTEGENSFLSVRMTKNSLVAQFIKAEGIITYSTAIETELVGM
ncbi:MAG: tartrate-resistant acid phosphatase type 5 family protein [Bacteroidota bacterium]